MLQVSFCPIHPNKKITILYYSLVYYSSKQWYYGTWIFYGKRWYYVKSMVLWKIYGTMEKIWHYSKLWITIVNYSKL